jgi:hypothetical protein
VGNSLYDILNGTQPGNFGWLSWTGNTETQVFVASLTPPGNNSTYINPNAPSDHIMSVGDWITGLPGVRNAKEVRDALDRLKSTDIVVPLWDQSQIQGSNTRYRVGGFARVRILSYQLSGPNRISVRFLGYTQCGDKPGSIATTDQTPYLVANDDAYIVPAGSALTAYILTNDYGRNGVVLQLLSTTAPAHGTVVIPPDNTLIYTPDNGFSGEDSFLYTVTSSDGETASATVVMIVGDDVERPIGNTLFLPGLYGDDGSSVKADGVATNILYLPTVGLAPDRE